MHFSFPFHSFFFFSSPCCVVIVSVLLLLWWVLMLSLLLLLGLRVLLSKFDPSWKWGCRRCLMSLPCMESQGCQSCHCIDLVFFLLSCFSYIRVALSCHPASRPFSWLFPGHFSIIIARKYALLYSSCPRTFGWLTDDIRNWSCMCGVLLWCSLDSTLVQTRLLPLTSLSSGHSTPGLLCWLGIQCLNWSIRDITACVAEQHITINVA